MKKLLADMHMHTLVSGHAYGTIREMAATAAEKELSLIGITEHAPGIPGTVDPFYYLNLEVIPRTIHGVEVLHGSEINVLNDGTLSLGQRYIDHLDYAIAGIHMQCYENAGRDQNTTNLIECMKHDKVRFVSHPDDDRTPLDYDRLIQAARDYHVALEVNNSSLIKKEKRVNCYDNYRTMLDLCSSTGCRSPSARMHTTSGVGNFTLALELLEEIGFDEDLILTNDIDKLKSFIR